MAYKVVGADEDGHFPPRVEEALSATYAPVSGSANYATPASVSAAVAPKLDSATAASTYTTPTQAAGLSAALSIVFGG